MAESVVFDFFSGRLHFIRATDDSLLNIKLWHYLSAFESHVFGVCLQYSRIISDLAIHESMDVRSTHWPQAGLDIYYYVLTWDKLKEIYKKIQEIVNDLQRAAPSIPKEFVAEFRIWKKRMDHLLAEFDKEVRNEYEHPSLEPLLTGNMIMWGNMMSDGSGNITAHAGKDRFTTIKKEHCARIQELRTDLIDIFLKHFSEKPLTAELVKARDYIEENIDFILNQLQEFRVEDSTAEFNKLLHTLLMHDLYLMKEGVPLSTSAKERLYSAIASNGANNT